MSLSYAKVIATLPTQVREVKDYLTKKNMSTIPSSSELYLESTDVHEDNEGNMWIFCPTNKMYYELYRKSKNQRLIDIFPTIAAEITSDCKAGLALYRDSTVSSGVIERRKSGEIYHITSEFYMDEKENSWVKSITIDETEEGFHPTIGWLIYKNARNNFANLKIHGKYTVLIKDGKIDLDRVEEFKEYLKSIRFNWMYDVTAEPLQLFASKTKSSVKVGVTKDNKKGSITVKEYKGDKAVTSDIGNRKHWAWRDHKHTKAKITSHAPDVVQNSRSFPKNLGKEKGIYHYDYFINYSKDGLLDDMDLIREHFNLDVQTPDRLYDLMTSSYNRFKLANPNDVLSKGFPHVFFTRPDCHYYHDETKELLPQAEHDPNIQYVLAHKPELIYQLCQDRSTDIWMYLLSNKTVSFLPTDESISVDTYGETYHKHKISFGKSNEESKSAGTFNIEVADTKDLDILELHKLWTEYINNIYHGKWIPKHKYMRNKVIDYACSCYYIITAEDGERIIFWSKYYGVFPLNIPSSAYAWQTGEPVKSSNLNITYQYSFKEDFNPQSLIEFNLNSGIKSLKDITYEATYNPYLGFTGNTWVGKPFIETCVESGNADTYFKLRFQKRS